MISEKKDSFEKMILDGFSRFYRDFPQGRLIKSESPDFILWKSPKRAIGIELTRLHFPFEAGVSSPDMEGITNATVNRAEQIFLAQTGVNLYVHFILSEPALKEEAIIPASAVLAAHVEKSIAGRDFGREFRMVSSDGDLPFYAQKICIYHRPGAGFSFWEAGRGSDRTACPETILSTIRAKEGKIRTYHRKHIESHWLLMSGTDIGRCLSQGMIRRLKMMNAGNPFHRIFLFDFFERKVYDLSPAR